jgi:pimeloyl-ACP methyl ester carboxylesterase
VRRPELHFAHANGVPSACYAKLFRALEPRFRVRFVPKIGADPRYPVEETCRGVTEQVAHSIRAQCDGPVVGVGHSLGGITTFMAAHRYPELFERVIILDPPLFDGLPALMIGLLKAIGRADAITPAKKSQGRREHFPSREAVREALGKKALFRAFDRETFEDYLRFGFEDADDGVRLAIPKAVEVAIFRITPHDWWRYRKLPVRGSLLLGAQSEFRTLGTTPRFARKHGLRHEVVEGSHMFPLEHPLETAASIIAHTFGREADDTRSALE